MTPETKQQFENRILSIMPDDKALYGKMNVNQMICHCTDQFRMMFGEIKGLLHENVDINELKQKAFNKETIQTVKGLDQAAGEGTKPEDFQCDVEKLIQYLNKFYECENTFKFSFHPFFGDIDKVWWDRLVVHHLNHHLEQFGR